MATTTTALATDNFRNKNIRGFIEDALNPESENTYYVFLGKPTVWSSSDDTPEDPVANESEYYFNRIKNELVGIKKIQTGSADLTFLIERINWISGTTYNFWDPHSNVNTNFYVLASNFNVYKCILSPGTPSANEPTHAPTYNKTTGEISGETRIYPDGYVWRYMYNISATDADTYLTNNFMPYVESNDKTSIDFQLRYAKDVSNRIWGLKLEDGASAPTSPVTIKNEKGADETISIFPNGSTISFVEIPSVGSEVYEPANLSGSLFEVDGEDPDLVKPLISPVNGHGTDVSVELNGIFAGIGVKFDDDDAPTIPKVVDIRQIGIIRNPAYFDGPQKIFSEVSASAENQLVVEPGADFSFRSENPNDYLFYNNTTDAFVTAASVNINTAGDLEVTFVSGVSDTNPITVTAFQSAFDEDIGSGLTKLVLDGATGTNWVGQTIEVDGNSTTKAYVAAQEEINGNALLYIVQNETTGFEPFTDTDSITFVGLNTTVDIDEVIEPDLLPFSGQILFVENRTAVKREANQIEDFRITIEF